MARPRLPSTRQPSKHLGVRLSLDDHALLDRLAVQGGFGSPSAWIRAQIRRPPGQALKAAPAVPPSPALVHQLARIGANLNQLAKSANVGAFSPDDVPHLKAAVAELRPIIEKLRR